MKKWILILVIVFFLLSCSQETTDGNNDIDDTYKQDELTPDDLENYDVSFVYVERFFKFEDLWEDRTGDFYYGK